MFAIPSLLLFCVDFRPKTPEKRIFGKKNPSFIASVYLENVVRMFQMGSMINIRFLTEQEKKSFFVKLNGFHSGFYHRIENDDMPSGQTKLCLVHIDMVI